MGADDQAWTGDIFHIQVIYLKGAVAQTEESMKTEGPDRTYRRLNRSLMVPAMNGEK